jgi:hypothetical protein
VRFERTAIGLEVQKSSVSPVYRALWCLPIPIYRGKNVQAVHCFYGVVRVLHQNCTRNSRIKSKANQAEIRKGDSNTSVQLGIATHIEEPDPVQSDLGFQTPPSTFHRGSSSNPPLGDHRSLERECRWLRMILGRFYKTRGSVSKSFQP